MNSEHAVNALALARQSLLEPAGIGEQELSKLFARLLAARVDDADLYFQYSRHEAWSLEEGIVKSGSHNIECGVGVRAVAGEKQGFAYSDDATVGFYRDLVRERETEGGRALGVKDILRLDDLYLAVMVPAAESADLVKAALYRPLAHLRGLSSLEAPLLLGELNVL